MRATVWIERPHPDYGIWIERVVISDPLENDSLRFVAKVNAQWSDPTAKLTFGPIGPSWPIR
jgi:hypothetical protein